MKIMRYILIVVAALTVLASCSKSDKELLSGTWGIQEMKKDGEVAMSLDPKEQQKIIDKAWAKDGAMMEQMGMDKAALAKSMEEQSKNLAKVTFVFGENGKVKVSANDGKSKDVFSPYTMNEEKKEITIEEENKDKLTYTYTISDEQLILKQKKDELIFKRKS
ncbi:MAG: hypothetical protein A3D31_18440 [Candidatus Fluviicola riflensis]|nr:MAG: hypothetical protein CHH17_03720 [Candidatus Fluviicola riflensis]OGS76428.1 MAG: hypothetical protein A3D31_18440 [Candidatus Fluviicola riflensis]OGS82722.1 MAG: hypothetical protein A2724_13265 [Fluviicola sp. RIFCSPHIGHO2_01_FULL_43_53]OGS89021.1 MAG: hypothetical protein A3E30_16925 [Fluviicola sp. RIFCSPHIGHO2_12_FULL_43_24]